MNPRATPERSGFSVGAVFAAALLCVGFQSFVHSLRLPLSALVIFLIRRNYPDTIVNEIDFAWIAQVSTAIVAALLTGAGLGLGGWLRSDS
jgi:hypothetical protein